MNAVILALAGALLLAIITTLADPRYREFLRHRADRRRARLNIGEKGGATDAPTS